MNNAAVIVQKENKLVTYFVDREETLGLTGEALANVVRIGAVEMMDGESYTTFPASVQEIIKDAEHFDTRPEQVVEALQRLGYPADYDLSGEIFVGRFVEDAEIEADANLQPVHYTYDLPITSLSRKLQHWTEVNSVIDLESGMVFPVKDDNEIDFQSGTKVDEMPNSWHDRLTGEHETRLILNELAH